MARASRVLPAGRQRRLSRLLQVAIAVVLAVGVWERNVAVVVNAGLALASTFIPAALARDRGRAPPPGVTLWITGALFLHTVGMVGLYERLWWWDHLTHALSATIVAGVGYVTARALDDHSTAVTFPSEFLVVYVVIFTMAAGVLWEVLEFGARAVAIAIDARPVLILYGLEDTLLDLVFDAVGATVLALFGTPRLEGLVDRLRRRALAR